MSKELIKKYADIDYPNDKRMNDYILKSTSDVIKTSQGFLIRFEKPIIETRFCFGYGQNGISTEDDRERANEMRDYASESEKYFIEENLKGINEQIKDIEEADKVYFTIGNKKTPALRYVKTDDYLRYNNMSWHEKYFFEDLDAKEATKEDIELLLTTLKSEKEKFVKRIRTYLKRYGLSKVHSWTYLVD